ncbi:MAG TPA: hypothetical protein PLE55_07815 [Clostridiales bacterium]|nr:hypothetical protein [Clostridiales bacterium]
MLDFRFKFYAGLCENLLLNDCDKFQNVFAGRRAGIDNKAGVLFADLCAANLHAFEAAVFDQFAGVMVLRPFKNAAGTRIFERLAFLSAAVEGFHFGPNRFTAARPQAQNYIRYDFAYGHESAGSVFKIQL